jgi:hypothetical protein
MTEPQKITILEGPPPTFEAVADPILYGLWEAASPAHIVMCRLRAHNGPALIERCYRAWKQNQPITLEFKTEDGLTIEAPIVASRWAEVDEGDVLMLWLAMEEVEFEIDPGFGSGINLDDFSDPLDDDDFDDSDLDLGI